MYVNAEYVTYFDSFAIEHIPKEVEKFIGNKTIITNIYSSSIGFNNVLYFCVGFINFILKGSLLEFTNEYEKKWQNNIKIFPVESKEVKMYCNISNKYRKLKKN